MWPLLNARPPQGLKEEKSDDNSRLAHHRRLAWKYCAAGGLVCRYSTVVVVAGTGSVVRSTATTVT
jgi:hypothetical protein